MLNFLSITPTLLRPESYGQLGLRSSHPKSPPKINANLLGSQKDIDVIMEGVRLVKKLVEAPPLNKMLTLDPTPVKGCESHQMNSDEYWACVIIYETNPENHQVGTCKMGHADDRTYLLLNLVCREGLTWLFCACSSLTERSKL